jgi:hypothetical protein
MASFETARRGRWVIKKIVGRGFYRGLGPDVRRKVSILSNAGFEWDSLWFGFGIEFRVRCDLGKNILQLLHSRPKTSLTRWLGPRSRCSLSRHGTEPTQRPVMRGKRWHRGFASQELGQKWANWADCIWRRAWKRNGKENKKGKWPGWGFGPGEIQKILKAFHFQIFFTNIKLIWIPFKIEFRRLLLAQ